MPESASRAPPPQLRRTPALPLPALTGLGTTIGAGTTVPIGEVAGLWTVPIAAPAIGFLASTAFVLFA